MTISRTVGRNGVNKPEDVFTIKRLLNGISSDIGGTDNTLDEMDVSDVGENFLQLINAIVSFQQFHFSGIFPADGLIQPGHRTLRRMQELFLQRQDPGLSGSGTITPTGSLFGDTDALGFSSAGLTRNAPGEWTSRNDQLPTSQMVPFGGTRTLVVNMAQPLPVTFTMDDTSIAAVFSSTDKTVTILGLVPGVTQLQATIGPKIVLIQIIVRTFASMVVNAIHLGPARIPGTESRFVNFLLPTLNRIWQPQANIMFTLGTVITLNRIRLSGTFIDIDPAADFIVTDGSVAPPGSKQIATWDDLTAAVTEIANITMFLSPRLKLLEDSGVDGEAKAVGSSLCWFNTATDAMLNKAITPAHEIGHCLGLPHITAAGNEPYLMAPDAAKFHIPSETLGDLQLFPKMS